MTSRPLPKGIAFGCFQENNPDYESPPACKEWCGGALCAVSLENPPKCEPFGGSDYCYFCGVDMCCMGDAKYQAGCPSRIHSFGMSLMQEHLRREREKQDQQGAADER